VRPINRDILKLAIPSILANITVPLVGMVDIAVAGHLEASAAAMIGGIAIGTMLFDLLYWNFCFLRVGTSGLTAQAYGRRDVRDCANIFSRSILLSLAIALVLIAIQWGFVSLAFLAVKCTPEVKELATQYFFIRIWAAPATLGLMAFKGWFIGMQDSVSSMATDLVVNAVNILASIVLALGIPSAGFDGLGFKGVAFGTVTAQYSGLLTAWAILFFKYGKKVFGSFGLKEIRASLKGEPMRNFFSINGDIFVRSFCFIGIYIGFTIISARYGDVHLASASILMKLLMIFSYFTDGFAYAAEAIGGRAIGAKERKLLDDCVKWTFIWSGAIALAFVAIYIFWGPAMLRMMTGDETVVKVSRLYLPWLALMPVIGVAAFTWDGVFIGATATKAIRNAMLVALAAFFLVWFAGVGLVENNNAAIHLLMAAYFAHLLARTVYLTVRYRKDVVLRYFPYSSDQR